MLIKEFRIPIPVDIEKYHIGQLYMVASMSKEETDKSQGVKILKNELVVDKEMQECQYTHKQYNIGENLPNIIKSLAPASALILDEYAWNKYPICKTILKNAWMSETFKLSIDTIHSSEMDVENIHGLGERELKKREIVLIDIAEKEHGNQKEFKSKEKDPTTFHSVKTGLGPLKPGWYKDPTIPKVCCYKLIKVQFKMMLISSSVESYISRMQKILLTTFHKNLFCTIDEWYDMTIDDIRKLEDQTKEELDEATKV